MINAVVFYKIGRWFFLKKIPMVSTFFELIIFLIYNSKVPMSSMIGQNTYFAYGGIGCVLHARTVIGSDCSIGTNVTIGGKSKHYNVPVIGDNVYIATGAKILGPITIGSNVTIGANAVVIYDVPHNAVMAGVPAKIIKYNE